jgi:hypothetical protein
MTTRNKKLKSNNQKKRLALHELKAINPSIKEKGRERGAKYEHDY